MIFFLKIAVIHVHCRTYGKNRMHRNKHTSIRNLGSFQNPEWQKHPPNQDFDKRNFVVEILSISVCGECVVIVHIKTINPKTIVDI